ncbi:DUF7159 family protein [Mycobacterium avium]|uniref:DUF7159 family protein n=1 Tax=Mycobacterium avium TaxID=1764 RepID=UPI0003D21C8F|nr:hypothetical protein [Mycobacterium avium]ETA92364.1 hypothetical protein O984_13275 [Mycobacterium avium 05-4293]ETB24928.1 hypothetical protein O983_12135 [Mycobacterium avium 09-5983]MDV3288221.1 hypothetical protein [Mycobacterium avium subsp. hominissuis]MDV3299305.1 hypothetical protein [Mycobacterium avium]MDV3304015.1 hypothetical protein [Mycobacterium avium subsp. hominissuis]
MDTVFGLSVTPTTVGWVLAEGHGADGTILDHQELALHSGGALRAASAAEQVVDEVLRVEAAAAGCDRRLRVIGVTWNDEASVPAALVLEALTDAGLHNVVPVRFLQAVETLAQAIAPVIGYEQTAVCVLEHDWTTVVMVDSHDGQTQTATKQVRGGFDGLTRWLTGMFERDGWQPGGIVVVGAHSDIDGLSWQLEKALPVPVFVQSMAQVTIARGAALSAARSTEFTDEQLVARRSEPVTPAPVRHRRLSYAGAMTALTAGAISFVGSVSLAVGIHVGPASATAAAKHATHPPAPQVAEAVKAVTPLPAAPQTKPQTKPPSGPAPAPAGEPAAPDEQPGIGDDRQMESGNRQPYLTRVLEHIPGDTGEPAADSAPHPTLDPQP